MKPSVLRFAVVALVISQLLGCVGGGGEGDVATGDGTSTGTTTTTTTAAPKIVITLADKSTGAAVTSISPTAPAIATAKVTSSTGTGVSGAIVTFTIGNSALATLTPASGTVLTDASGMATIQIDAAGISSAGATSVTAASTVAKSATDTTTVAVSGSANFSVGSAAAGLTGLSNGLATGVSLSPYSTTSISATVTGVPTTTSVAVSFSSGCSSSGKATLPATVNTVNGKATATYTDNGCAAQDTITVGIVGTSVTQAVTLTVNAPAATSIQFVSSTPSTIGIVGVGNPTVPTSSIVSFKVVDNSNHAVPSIPVTFDLSTRVGGILLNGVASGTVSQLTDASGVASVQVTAGSLPTPVSVTASATVGGATLSSQSNQLTITTGRPAQDRTSLAVGTHNIEGWNFFGTTTNVSISLADRLGNPVPDGTAINFVADGAAVGAQCATASGRCSVTFTSANTQGQGKTEPAGIVTAGRIKVLAYAVGEESFVDANNNNLFTTGEVFNDLGDPFMDSNENAVYDAGEFTLVSGGALACASGIATSPFAPSRTNTCDGAWGTNYVRQSATIILSGSTAYIGAARPSGATVVAQSATSSTTMGGKCAATHTFWAYDLNG